MNETAAPPTPAPAAAAAAHASRTRLVVARVLTVVGILLVVISVLANFVKREALDSSHFRDTSRALIADPAIRDQISATLVDQLYSRVDVAGALRRRLPSNLNGLAGPIAGVARDAAGTAAQRMLERPRVQSVFVTAATAAHQELVAVLDGDTKFLQTTGGNVVLDLRPLVLDLGARFSFVPDLADKIPEGTARVTILRSNELETAQRGTRALRFVADWIWALALAAWAGAIWLARGRRRIEVRAIAIGVLLSGFLILIVRRLLGRYLVDHLVASESVRPAVASAYSIITDLLKGAGWTAVIVGVIAVAGAWLAGHGRRAVAARRWLAPHLRRAEVAYGGLVIAYLLLLWWKPTPQFGILLDVLLFFVLAAVGLEVLRRQTAREFPVAESGDMLAAARGAVTRAWAHRGSHNTTGELERLAQLHAAGALDDAEFAQAKARLLGGEVRG
jgi:hypothetical protein